MKRARILVDSDGVMSNFVGEVICMINSETGSTYTYDDAIQWDLYKALGVSEEAGKDFDTLIRQPRFCYELETIDGAKEGLDELRKFADVYCVTTPFDDAPFWINEREQWLVANMGFTPKEILPVHPKFLIAGDYLIDDKMDNLSKWNAEPYTGTPILFDQPWNRSYSEKNRAYGWSHLVALVKQLESNRKCGK